MQKIPSLFVRNYAGDRKVLDQVVPGSEWVVQGEGVATRKWDGVAVLVRHGNVFKRFDAKAGRTPPPNFEPLQTAPDANTGHWPGWVPAKLPDDRWILEGIAWGVAHRYPQGVPDGTYEVCGPRIGTRHGATRVHGMRPRLLWHDRSLSVVQTDSRCFRGIRRLRILHR